MSLNVVLGRSNTGKSEYIYNKIMACEKEKRQAILFVPSFYRVEAEKEYLKYTNKQSIVNTKITSIERFVSSNVSKEKLYKDKIFLPEMSKKMLIKKVIMENPDMFNVFSRVKNTSGFADKIYDYVSKLEDIDNNENIIARYANDDFLKAKLIELYDIYRKVNDILKEKFVTTLDELNYYITQNTNSNNNDNNEYFFDNYNNFSNTEYRFIEMLLIRGNSVTISLDIDIQKEENGVTTIYDMSKNTLNILKEICAKSGVGFNEINLETSKKNRPNDLEFLGNHLFDITKNNYDGHKNNIDMFLVANTYDEIKYVANDILKKSLEGYRYSDFVIYTNNIEQYYIPIKKLCYMYQIPIYLNQKQRLMDSILTNYLLTLLNIVSKGYGKDLDLVLALLKTGLVSLNNEAILKFESYVLENGIKGYNLEKDFKFTDEEKENSDVINELKDEVIAHVSDLKKQLSKSKTTKEITKCIYDHLLKFKVVERFENIVNKLRDDNVNLYDTQIQTLNKIYEIMDNICLAYNDLDLDTYIELLRFGINESEIDTIPSKIDQVEICDINKNRGSEKKIGYIIGGYEGGLPSTQNEDNIFTDIELEKLEACKINLKNSSETRNNMQLFNIYQAINKIREKLILTVPASTLSGSSLRPSSIISTVSKMFDIKLNSAKIEALNLSEKFMENITAISNFKEDEQTELLTKLYTEYSIYSKIKEYSELMQYARKDENLDVNTLNKIYGREINSSISRLENFKRCPFAYYTNYILNLSEKRKYEISKLDVGTLMHSVIEKISSYILLKNFSWQDIVLDKEIEADVMKQTEKAIDELFETKYYKFLTSPRYIVLKNKLKNTMKRTIKVIADSFNHSKFRPIGYEVEFDNGALYAPIQIQLNSGKKMYLRGKIDRVDSYNYKDNVYLRIVDYKSSDKNLKLSDVKDGISLQLMTYMWALLENKDKITDKSNLKPAAVTYFTISNKLLKLPNYEVDENKISEKLKKALKLRGIYITDIEILKDMDNKVEDSKASYLEVSSKMLSNPQKALPEETFIKECKNMKEILKQIGEELTSGMVKICPNKNIDNVCEYCSYNTLCRKNILN